MIADQCALIITSSVHVSAPYTQLVDPVQRERQYIDAISFFIRESPLDRIIVCDNSGHIYPVALFELARFHHKKMELLSFAGDNEKVARYGKGYGEGEIMRFVMDNSLLIREVKGFLKVTGRLQLVNINRVLKRIDPGENYFMPISLLRPRFLVTPAARVCVEVRVYYATLDLFREVLLNAYQQVRDDQVFFLEHAYYQAIAASGVRVKLFPTAPEITGISGSNGWKFKERSYAKKILIQITRRLGYIRSI